MIIIGFHGRSESGKSLACDILKDKFKGFQKTAFASPLKDITSLLYGIDRAKLDTQEGKRELSPIKFGDLEPKKTHLSGPPDHYITNRQLLQVVADALRSVIPDTFVKALQVDIERHESVGCERVVVEDVRYQNEAVMLHDLGGFVIRVNRQGQEESIKHGSEEPLSKNNYDEFIINTNNLREYEKKVCDTFVDLTGIQK